MNWMKCRRQNNFHLQQKRIFSVDIFYFTKNIFKEDKERNFFSRFLT